MTFATKQRILLGLAVLMILTPTFLYASGRLGQAPLFEGDSRQEMTCLTCDGLGKVKEEACPICHGTGVAVYIIPGPNRPAQLVGTVLDAKKKPLTGAEIEATVPGQEGVPLQMLTNDNGQFGLKLPPGQYHLVIKHASGVSHSEDLTVGQNTEAIPARGTETLHVLEKTFTLQ